MTLDTEYPEHLDKVKEIVKATDLVTALDDNQHLLCTTASSMKDSSLKDNVNRIRIVTIQQIAHLRVLLSSQNQEEEFSKALIDWKRYTSRLGRDFIKSFEPGLRPKNKTRTSLTQIMKYQVIEETEMEEALKTV